MGPGGAFLRNVRPQGYWAVRLDGTGKIVITYRAVGEELVTHIDVEPSIARQMADAIYLQLAQIDEDAHETS